MLENTRFNPGETANDPEFARELADGHDLFVEDAFGSVHRAHASTVGVAELLPAYAGLLLERELQSSASCWARSSGRSCSSPAGPRSRTSSACCATSGEGGLRPRRGKMAEELRDGEQLPFPVELPSDVVAASDIDSTDTEVIPYDRVPPGSHGFDVGPETRSRFAARIGEARTVFWNGPMGVFEKPQFAEGTRAVAEAVAVCEGYTVVGGADSIRALAELGLVDQVDWASTGGGAALELLEGKKLPGVAVIPED